MLSSIRQGGDMFWSGTRPGWASQQEGNGKRGRGFVGFSHEDHDAQRPLCAVESTRCRGGRWTPSRCGEGDANMLSHCVVIVVLHRSRHHVASIHCHVVVLSWCVSARRSSCQRSLNMEVPSEGHCNTSTITYQGPCHPRYAQSLGIWGVY
jgi:hypothetical protein